MAQHPQPVFVATLEIYTSSGGFSPGTDHFMHIIFATLTLVSQSATSESN